MIVQSGYASSLRSASLSPPLIPNIVPSRVNLFRLLPLPGPVQPVREDGDGEKEERAWEPAHEILEGSAEEYVLGNHEPDWRSEGEHAQRTVRVL